MNHLKSNPVGLDKAIDVIQRVIYDKLNYSDVEGYGRAYMIERNDRTIPTIFIDGIDYEEIILGKNNLVFFFIASNEIEVTSSLSEKANIEIIFLLDIKKLKPNSLHRADEELRVEVTKILSNQFRFDLVSIKRGKNNIGFDSELIDMQPYLFLTFKGIINYKLKC